jgi:hypothetical protein
MHRINELPNLDLEKTASARRQHPKWSTCYVYMSAHHDANPELTVFLSSIDTDRLCAAASVLRPGVYCNLGEKILGGEWIL